MSSDRLDQQTTTDGRRRGQRYCDGKTTPPIDAVDGRCPSAESPISPPPPPGSEIVAVGRDTVQTSDLGWAATVRGDKHSLLTGMARTGIVTEEADSKGRFFSRGSGSSSSGSNGSSSGSSRGNSTGLAADVLRVTRMVVEREKKHAALLVSSILLSLL